MKINYKSIGRIHTPFKNIKGMPIQSKGSIGIKGTIRLKKEFVKGLLDLAEFSHIYLIYHFHKSKDFNLNVIPFLDNKPHGIFATRAPKRPNPIGISVVKLISIKDNILEIENVDMLDGTPLLDIKPYISQFDIHEIEKNGWINRKTGYPDETRSDNRFK
ncbi:MAG: tRNA (N6-threonylcarbamoyladenosine(37)-N6)-methyltransferase TrmO [Marinilabiliaceae bacterium]|jgi:tRNA-Thr(GGU) m(6)t(6)A37 methyltransferase TsaA|nr:tRNA (N6-threonylcarbamoyladenosine(37)-N6)-methyltransferase TrmO [Marinilabiliaceae bacterium]